MTKLSPLASHLVQLANAGEQPSAEVYAQTGQALERRLFAASVVVGGVATSATTSAATAAHSAATALGQGGSSIANAAGATSIGQAAGATSLASVAAGKSGISIVAAKLLSGGLVGVSAKLAVVATLVVGVAQHSAKPTQVESVPQNSTPHQVVDLPKRGSPPNVEEHSKLTTSKTDRIEAPSDVQAETSRSTPQTAKAPTQATSAISRSTHAASTSIHSKAPRVARRLSVETLPKEPRIPLREPQEVAQETPISHLREETAELHKAQRLLRMGQVGAALTLLDASNQRYGTSGLGIERRALRIIALCQSATRQSDGRREAVLFEQQHPGSPMLGRLQRSCKH